MDEKALLEAISKMMDERDQRLSKMMDEKLEAQTAEIKNFIVKNNVAIGETLTQALEESKQDSSKNKLYKIIPLEG